MKKGTRHWTDADLVRLTALFPTYPRQDVMKAFPSRSWSAIGQQAGRMGLKRKWKWTGLEVSCGDDLLTALRARRKDLGWTSAKTAQRAGYSARGISHAERGCAGLSYRFLKNWCEALGVRLVIEPIERRNDEERVRLEAEKLSMKPRPKGPGVPVNSNSLVMMAAE